MQVKHVAIACRISEDTEGRGEGVDDQETWGRDYAVEHFPGLPVVVYRDNNISATDRETERPDFERLTADIQAGLVAHIVCTERSRLIRDAAGWFDYVDDVLLPAGIEVLHTRARGVMHVDDLAADVDAVLGRREVRVLRKRVLNKHARLAEQGRPHGGRRLGFVSGRDEEGRSTLEIVEEEADALRWAADAVLSGASLSIVAREWERRALPHPRGGKGPWRPEVVKKSLMAPSIAGLRIHHGVLRPATWEPILDEATWRRVVAALEHRTTVVGTNGKPFGVPHRMRPPRRWLLTGGIAVCGRPECGSPLGAQYRSVYKGRSPMAYYQCLPPARGGCSRLGILAEKFEAEVERRLLEHLDELAEFKQALATDEHEAKRDGILVEMTAVDKRRRDLARRWAAGLETEAERDAAREVLDADEERLSKELADLPAPAVDVDPAAIREAWGEMTFYERRRVVEIFIKPGGIVVLPAQGRNRFNPDRIAPIAWRI